MPTLTTTIQHTFGSLATAIREETEKKGIQIGKEVNSLADDMILYKQSPKDSTRKLLEIINTEIRLIIFFAVKDGEALYSQ